MGLRRNPDFVRGDVYNNMVASFQRVPVAILYIVANLALGVHLFHGAWSLFQSLGLEQPAVQQVAPVLRPGFAGDHRRSATCSFPIVVQAKRPRLRPEAHAIVVAQHQRDQEVSA